MRRFEEDAPGGVHFPLCSPIWATPLRRNGLTWSQHRTTATALFIDSFISGVPTDPAGGSIHRPPSRQVSPETETAKRVVRGCLPLPPCGPGGTGVPLRLQERGAGLRAEWEGRTQPCREMPSVGCLRGKALSSWASVSRPWWPSERRGTPSSSGAENETWAGGGGGHVYLPPTLETEWPVVSEDPSPLLPPLRPLPCSVFSQSGVGGLLKLSPSASRLPPGKWFLLVPQLSVGREDPPLVTALPGHLLSISSALLPNTNGDGLQTRGMRDPLGVPCPLDQRASSSCSLPLAVSPPAAPGGLPTSPSHSPLPPQTSLQLQPAARHPPCPSAAS